MFAAHVAVNVAALALVSLAYRAELERQREERLTLVGDALRLYGDRAVRADDARGRRAALARLEQHAEARVAILAGGRLVAGHALQVPEGLEARAAAAQGLVTQDSGGATWVAMRSSLADHVVVGRLVPHTSHGALPFAPATLQLALAILAAALASFGLARLVSGPLRALRRAVGKVAAGDLAQRVAPRLSPAADGEARALARDFDRMTDRVRALLEAREQLLRDVSHELRSPMVRLSVALELARRRAGPGAAEPLDRMENELERLNELVGSMLAMARLDHAVGVPEAAPVRLDALIERVRADADFEAQAAGCGVVVTETACAVVQGSAEILRRALENVVRNAVRFTPAGTAVELALRVQDRWAQIEVRDRGPGVPDDALEVIFQPFTRLDPSRDATSSGGAGIGLAIVRRAMQMHGGEASARNAGDGGLVVTLRVPLTNSDH